MWKKFRNWDLVEIGIKGIVQANDENNENLEIKFMELCSPSMIIISFLLAIQFVSQVIQDLVSSLAPDIN